MTTTDARKRVNERTTTRSCTWSAQCRQRLEFTIVDATGHAHTSCAKHLGAAVSRILSRRGPGAAVNVQEVTS